ncbi:MAG: ECF transporter S component [Dialister invisus]
MQQNDTSGLPHKIKWITLCGLLMAINTIFSSFSVPVPGGHIYLNDIIIVIAALSLDPLGAFLVGGVGAFLGDFFFYPLPMFVSLATHGIRSVVMSLIVGRYGRDNSLSFLARPSSAPHRHRGIHLGKVYVYSTWEYAMLKLPFEILQAFIGSASDSSSGKQKMGPNDPPLSWVLIPYSP